VTSTSVPAVGPLGRPIFDPLAVKKRIVNHFVNVYHSGSLAMFAFNRSDEGSAN
jgi:hypothetical protein